MLEESKGDEVDFQHCGTYFIEVYNYVFLKERGGRERNN